METIEQIDRECAALGGLFQQVVNDMKAGVPHYEDFINKAGKLHSQLKCTILALGSFLDTFQKIADSATNTKGATKEIGSCLTRIVLRHKSMEARMKALCSALLDCLVLPLQDKLEDWKKVGHSLDKEHSKEFKKLRGELKKKSDNASRLIKKHKKSKGIAPDPKVEQTLAEANKQAATLHDVEKSAVRRVLVEERSRYCLFISCLKPVLTEEISMVSEFQQLEEVLTKLDKHTEEPYKLPEASEQVLNDIKTSSGGIVFQTPPSSPSSLGSRKSSMCSISSAGSSSGGSTNSPSHHLNKNRQGVNTIVGPMRLSSISSQDSGFTSQDTLFLRPGSPHRNKTPNGSDQELSGSGGSTPGGVQGGGGWPGLQAGQRHQGLVAGIPGPPLTDRPHTISSAYEKGGQHHRPALQPYTFNPPERIHEEDERPGSSSCDYEETGSTNSGPCGTGSKPPVPQRHSSTSSSRPYVPSKPAQFNVNGVPTFNCAQPDMVVPQPVYMNMADMNAMTAAKNNGGNIGNGNNGSDDSMELKTPTAEDLGGVEAEANEMADGGYCNGGYGTLGRKPPNNKQLHPNFPQHHGLMTPSPSRGGSILRPHSFTPSPEAASTPTNLRGMGSTPRGNGTILRRSLSQSCGEKPPGVINNIMQGGHQNRNSGTGMQFMHGVNSGADQLMSPPFPPPPPNEASDVGGSNNTTPRGSMEFLPPPPPHLLHSDEEGDNDGAAAGNESKNDNNCSMSVSESVRKLQQRHHSMINNQNAHGGMMRPGSPATLRRVQSMSAATPPQNTPPSVFNSSLQHHQMDHGQRASLKARLEAAMSSPRAQAPGSAVQHRPQSPNPAAAAGGGNNEVIYAPVAALQQKIQQQHQKAAAAAGHGGPGGNMMMNPGMVPHPPGPVFQQQPQHNSFQHQPQQQNNTYYNNKPHNNLQGVYPQHHDQQQYGHHQQQHYEQGQAGQASTEYGFGMQFQAQANQWYNQSYSNHQHYNHDQIMQDMDPTLGQRPQPPSLMQANNHGSAANSNAKVRQWIETRTVADVRKVRPVLNQEIQRGFSLRKTVTINDRSMPRF